MSDVDMEQSYSIAAKWASLAPLVLRASPFAAPNFEPAPENLADVTDNTRILVVGAGGLGCEILKDLALSGFTDLHVIDMDTVDVSNLNRQFLFRMKDCNKYKAQVAAEFIMKRVQGCQVQYHTKAIQDFSSKWYSQFDLVIAGLDNIQARQWLNETLVDLVKYDAEGNVDFSTVIPLIDGGTEGFGGQARVFMPRVTSCFECSLVSMAAQTGYPMCTIRNVPRIPEHCIMYAYKVQWPLLESFVSATEYKMYTKTDDSDETAPAAVTLDKDDIHHMTWIYHRAEERAKQFNIAGVTFHLTQQVVKNIIPAIASTNALISAACVNEAWKIRSNASLRLDNYFMYIGGSQTGINCETIKYGRNPDCIVCHTPIQLHISNTATLHVLLSQLSSEAKLQEPAVAADGISLYISSLHHLYEKNLNKTLLELNLKHKQQIVANDKQQQTKKVILHFIEDEEAEHAEADAVEE